MPPAPQRPPTVPAEARWIAGDQEWECGELDANGRKQGPFTYWRADGSLVNQCHFKDDRPNGPFLRYHETGEVSQSGRFVDGQLHGERVFFRSKGETTENFVNGCAPEIHMIVFRYDMGNTTSQACYDWNGDEVMMNGKPLPARPATVPADAVFDHHKRIWMQGRLLGNDGAKPPVKDGLWRAWTASGTLVLEEPFAHGKKTGVAREYNAETGALESEATYDGEGRKNGPALETLPDGHLFYDGAWEARGRFDDGAPQGLWTYRRNDSVFSVDFGERAAAEDLAAAGLAKDEPGAAERWRGLYQKHLDENKPAAALLALIRYTAARGERGALFTFLRARSVPLSPEAEMERAEGFARALTKSPFSHDEPERASAACLASCMGEILRGGNPEALLRAASVHLDQQGRSFLADDLIRAAMIFSPERADYNFTACLVAMSIGRAKDAHHFMAQAKLDDPGNGAFLEAYIDTCFRPFFFIDPTGDLAKTGPHYRPAECGITKDLQAIREKVADSLAWLSVIRRRVVARMHPEVREHIAKLTWLPQDYSELVGPAKMTEQEGNIGRVAGFSVPDLLKEAHKVWRFLCTACWACGMTEVDVPETISPPPELSRVVPEAWGRSFYLNDLDSNGESPLPAFFFRDRPVGEFPRDLADWIRKDVDGYTEALGFMTAPLAQGHYAEFYGGGGAGAVEVDETDTAKELGRYDEPRAAAHADAPVLSESGAEVTMTESSIGIGVVAMDDENTGDIDFGNHDHPESAFVAPEPDEPVLQLTQIDLASELSVPESNAPELGVPELSEGGAQFLASPQPDPGPAWTEPQTDSEATFVGTRTDIRSLVLKETPAPGEADLEITFDDPDKDEDVA